MSTNACQVTLAHPASSVLFERISSSPQRSPRYARCYVKKLSNPQDIILLHRACCTTLRMLEKQSTS